LFFFFSFGSVNVHTGENTQLALLKLKYIKPLKVELHAYSRITLHACHAEVLKKIHLSWTSGQALMLSPGIDNMHLLYSTTNALNIRNLNIIDTIYTLCNWYCPLLWHM